MAEDGTMPETANGAAAAAEAGISPEAATEGFRSIGDMLGVAQGDEAAARMPHVRLTPENLALVARLLGQLMHRVPLFLQNGVLWFFDYEGQRQEMTPIKFRTWIMGHVLIFEKRAKGSDDPIPCTMAVEHAATVLTSEDFRRGVRKITGVNTVRLPVIRRGGKLELLPLGWDSETGIYTVEGGLVYDEAMALEAARGWMERTFGTFPLTDARSMAVQVAAMLAPFVRHLPGGGGLKMGFLWLANKPESGKSVLAKAAQYAVFGRCPAVKLKKGEQLDKELEAMAIAGVPCIFLDNVRGGIDSPTIEAMMTSEESEGRAMGGHGLFTAKNSALLFVTGNKLKLNEDIERRFLVVDLFEKGDPMERRVGADEVLDDDAMKDPEWRGRMLSALWAMVRDWHAAGMPAGKVVRGSFERYSRMLGGVVEAAGYENPFQRAEIPDAINPDQMEFRELIGLIVKEMGERQCVDFTLQDMAKLARGANLFERMIGTQAEGKALTVKMDKVDKNDVWSAQDKGYLTEKQNAEFGYFIKGEAGREAKWNGRAVEFGKRTQARKSTYSVTLSWDPKQAKA